MLKSYLRGLLGYRFLMLSDSYVKDYIKAVLKSFAIDIGYIIEIRI